MSFHQNYWYHLTDDQLMAEHIARHKNQQPLQELEELKNNVEYGCSDPRMHPLHQDQSEEASKEAERRIDDDFGNLTGVLQSYIGEHKVLPYCVILHSLAYRYLGGGLLDPTHKDEEYPYRSSPQFTLMFWNLGNWCRSKFEKCPVPERFQQFIPHIDYSIDEEHEKFDENKSQFNNYFINVIKNFGGHLFMNCEAGSLYPHRARLEEVQMQTCFNDYHDLMVAARIGKDGYIRQIAGYCTDEKNTRVRQVSWAIFEVSWGKTKHRDTDEIVDLTRARMKMTRVCVCAEPVSKGNACPVLTFPGSLLHLWFHVIIIHFAQRNKERQEKQSVPTLLGLGILMRKPSRASETAKRQRQISFISSLRQFNWPARQNSGYA